MNIFKVVWGLLFRLFPCPTQVGLRRIGDPQPDSPVLVTCNFYTTVQRVSALLRKAGLGAWLLVADSKGVNVWCAAGGEAFNTASVVSALKTSGVADLVNHRSLILPPLGAPGISAAEVKEQTGWNPHWGPVRAEDIPRFIKSGLHREQAMKRVTYDLRERLDTALGALFPFYFIGAAGFLIISPRLLPGYFFITAFSFLFFFLLCPRLPGKRGLTKVIVIETVLAGALILLELFPTSCVGRAEIIMAMVMFLINGSELGGLASNMPSDLDPFLAGLGIGAIGNVALAGTIRTDLLGGYRKLTLDKEKCIGCRSCQEICPQGVWDIGPEKKATPVGLENCTACRACLVQCPTKAIEALTR